MTPGWDVVDVFSCCGFTMIKSCVTSLLLLRNNRRLFWYSYETHILCAVDVLNFLIVNQAECVYTYICMYVCVCVYIYIYI